MVRRSWHLAAAEPITSNTYTWCGRRILSGHRYPLLISKAGVDGADCSRCVAAFTKRFGVKENAQ